MELIQTIALLCQISSGGSTWDIKPEQLKCHQYYIHCVGIKRSNFEEKEALQKCILEK